MSPAKVLLSFLFLLPALAWGGDREALLSFADALHAGGDHYRAVTEYKRFLFLYPEDAAAPHAALGVGEGLLAGERWEEAEAALAEAAARFPETPEGRRAALLHAGAPARRGDLAAARARYRLLPGAEARYRLAWTLIDGDRFHAAAEELARVPGEAPAALAAEMERMENLPRKSPKLAGALSALLPGAGQLYAGRPRDAALAFLLNTVFIWGAIEAFDEDIEVAGGLLLFFEAGWYSGNIYNAVNNAHKHNRDLREAEREKLRSRFGVTLDVDGTPGLGVQLHF